MADTMNNTTLPPTMNPIVALILQRIAEVLERLGRLETQVTLIAEDVDTIDRVLRPHGDGERIRRGRR